MKFNLFVLGLLCAVSAQQQPRQPPPTGSEGEMGPPPGPPGSDGERPLPQNGTRPGNSTGNWEAYTSGMEPRPEAMGSMNSTGTPMPRANGT